MIISRTYNSHGEKDFLTRMDGNCPVWCMDKRQAMQLTEAEAAAVVAMIATYRDWMCPNGIADVAAEHSQPARWTPETARMRVGGTFGT
jgi:hypothetical protein